MRGDSRRRVRQHVCGVQCFRASMYAVVAVTDKRWSDFLSARSHLTEANLWTPPSIGFRALTTGESMLFMTRAPHNLSSAVDYSAASDAASG